MRKLGFLIALLLAVVACTTDDEPELVIPTPGLFEVLTATPRPQATSNPAPTVIPVPTSTRVPLPTQIPTATAVPIHARPFPANIDPRLVTERPSDDELFAAWQKYLSDAEVRHVGANLGEHFCSDGTIRFPASAKGDLLWAPFEWSEIHRPPSFEEQNWQEIQILNHHLSRIDGKTVRRTRGTWSEVVVGDSWNCGESLVWQEAVEPPTELSEIREIISTPDGRLAFLDRTDLVIYDSRNDAWHVRNDLSFIRLRYHHEVGLIGFTDERVWFIDVPSARVTEGPDLQPNLQIGSVFTDSNGDFVIHRGPDTAFHEIYSPTTGEVTKVSPPTPFIYEVTGEVISPSPHTGEHFRLAPDEAPDVYLGDNRFLLRRRGNEFWIYDYENDTVVETASPSEVRDYGKLLQLDSGRALFYYGQVRDNFRTSVSESYEVYDPNGNTWLPWIPADKIEDGWVMVQAWNIGDEGVILGQFHHLEEAFDTKFGVLDPETVEWTYFAPPPGNPGSLDVIPLSHKRVMVIKKIGITNPEVSAWITRLP